MAQIYKDFVLDARPDRLDLRDREYLPRLKSLPPEFPNGKEIECFLPNYQKNGLVLDQGSEGACTGFGLAATINYLIWYDQLFNSSNNATLSFDTSVADLRVSERMLYHMARVYDEWDGEDYSGSSCRGAVKGWHKHGVCKKSLWEYDSSGRFLPPVSDDWAVDALQNPLGSYYRINHKSVVDMQAAIYEVGAIYCSASVHEGWRKPKTRKLEKIRYSDKKIGGHAFCLVGYNNQGFIVQNSWGNDWGWHGFAIISYADWTANGNDAWVVSRGVPLEADEAPRMFSNNSLQQTSNSHVDPSQATIDNALNYEYPRNFPQQVKPWSEDKAYSHAIVLSNNGRPKHTSIASEGPDASVKFVAEELLGHWLSAAKKNRKIAIYAHGGLNSEEASINRVRVMAPYFKANDIYPIFVVWKSGLSETIGNIIREAFSKSTEMEHRAEGFIEDIVEKFTDKTDTAIEVLARTLHAKSIWSEMKENAIYASDRAVPGFAQNRSGKAGGMVLLAQGLKRLSKTYPDLELHLVGHSAGSILLGSWLQEIQKQKLTVKTTSLFAPACTLSFANKTYKRAIEKGVLEISELHIHNMEDASERADNTGKLYRKSLLYLVSRALEDAHKMPLLGLQAAWDPDNYHNVKTGGFNSSEKAEATRWSDFMKEGNAPKLYGATEKRVSTNKQGGSIDLSHGSFDNSIKVLEFTLKKIRRSTLKQHIENLSGF